MANKIKKFPGKWWHYLIFIIVSVIIIEIIFMSIGGPHIIIEPTFPPLCLENKSVIASCEEKNLWSGKSKFWSEDVCEECYNFRSDGSYSYTSDCPCGLGNRILNVTVNGVLI